MQGPQILVPPAYTAETVTDTEAAQTVTEAIQDASLTDTTALTVLTEAKTVLPDVTKQTDAQNEPVQSATEAKAASVTTLQETKTPETAKPAATTAPNHNESPDNPAEIEHPKETTAPPNAEKPVAKTVHSKQDGQVKEDEQSVTEGVDESIDEKQTETALDHSDEKHPTGPSTQIDVRIRRVDLGDAEEETPYFAEAGDIICTFREVPEEDWTEEFKEKMGIPANWHLSQYTMIEASISGSYSKAAIVSGRIFDGECTLELAYLRSDVLTFQHASNIILFPKKLNITPEMCKVKLNLCPTESSFDNYLETNQQDRIKIRKFEN